MAYRRSGLETRTPLYEYEVNTWGPRETERVTPDGGWHNPIMVPKNLDLSRRAG